MKICYLLDSTDLSGGVRIVFDHARALKARGHQVVVRARFGQHGWYPYPVDIQYACNLSEKFKLGEEPDIVVATFWTTVQAALQIGSGRPIHFCQGHEADFDEYSAAHADIAKAYRLPIPKIVIGEWLQQRLELVYGKDAFSTFCIGQIVDVERFHPPRFPVHAMRNLLFMRPLRILVIGIFEASVKAISDALQAVALMRKACRRPIHLTRVSSTPLSLAESAITPIQSYHISIGADLMARLYCSSDLLLAPSLEQEGFGLPFAEALACGLPCVATSIPSFLSFDEKHDYAIFVPQRDPLAMANAALDLFRHTGKIKKLRRRGPQVVQKFKAADVAQRLEHAFIEIVR